MVNSDTDLRVLIQNDMVRLVKAKGSQNFVINIDDEFSDMRMEVRYTDGRFLIFNFNDNNEPIMVLAKELEWVRFSPVLNDLTIKFIEKVNGGNYEQANSIASKLKSAERGKVEGKSLQTTHIIVYAREVDMGFKYELKVEITKPDKKYKKVLKAIDTTRQFSLPELVREMQITKRASVDWLNKPADEGTIDDFMHKIKADKYSQVLITITAKDDGLEKSAKKFT